MCASRHAPQICDSGRNMGAQCRAAGAYIRRIRGHCQRPRKSRDADAVWSGTGRPEESACLGHRQGGSRSAGGAGQLRGGWAGHAAGLRPGASSAAEGTACAPGAETRLAEASRSRSAGIARGSGAWPPVWPEGTGRHAGQPNPGRRRLASGNCGVPEFRSRKSG